MPRPRRWRSPHPAPAAPPGMARSPTCGAWWRTRRQPCACSRAASAATLLRSGIRPCPPDPRKLDETGGATVRLTTMSIMAIACIDAYGQAAMTNLSGRVYENAVVTERRPNGLMLRHKTGMELVRWHEWPDSIKVLHGYDPGVEANAAEDARIHRKAQQVATDVMAKGFDARVAVKQLVDNGALAEVSFSRSTERDVVEYKETSRTVGLGGSRIDNTVTTRTPIRSKVTDVEWFRVTGLVFVAKIGGQGVLVDGSYTTRTLYPAGIYEYVSTDGAQRTVRKFTTDPMDLVDMDAVMSAR